MGKLTFGRCTTLSSRDHLYPSQLSNPALRFGYPDTVWAEVNILEIAR